MKPEFLAAPALAAPQPQAAFPGRARCRNIVGSAQLRADGLTFLYGGMEDEIWKEYLVAELASGSMQAVINLSPALNPITADADILAVTYWLANVFAQQDGYCVAVEAAPALAAWPVENAVAPSSVDSPEWSDGDVWNATSTSSSWQQWQGWGAWEQ